MANFSFSFARARSLAVATLTGITLTCGAFAQVPTQINYEGRLTDPGGGPVNGSVAMMFSLYTVPTSGIAIYTENQNVAVTNGIFDVAIGAVTPLALPFDVPYYLGVKVGADAEMTPRQAVLSSAYALRANTLATTATVGGVQIAGSITTATVPTSQLTGTIGTSQIANSAVTQAKLSPASGAAPGKVLGTDGTNLVWQTDASSGGTVTGVTAAAPLASSGGNAPSITLPGPIPGSLLASGLTLGGTTTGTFSGPLTGNATTATALAANGANCAAGQFPLGVDAAGSVEGCTAATPGGQAGITAFGTSALTLSTGAYTDVPGLSATITVPATANGSAVYVATDGGVAPSISCVVASCSVIVDVVIVVDGGFLPHAGIQQITCLDNAAVWQNPTAYWSMHQVLNLAAGSHTVKVQAHLAGSFNAGGAAIVSGGDGGALQGELTLLLLNK